MSKHVVNAYLDTLDRIEPDVHPLDRDGALASIAISQKRQADALERIALALEKPRVIINNLEDIYSGEMKTLEELYTEEESKDHA